MGFRRLVAAILGLAMGAIGTTIPLDDGEVCYCYQVQANQAEWTDNCPANYPEDHPNRCPDDV